MKHSKIAVSFISCILILSQISAVGLSAGQNDSLNSLLLLERNFESSDKKFDLNMDNNVDIMDLCRKKRNILYSISSSPVWFSTGNAEINYYDKTVRIPLYINDVQKEISELSMDLTYDKNIFRIKNISAEGIARNMRISENNGILTVSGGNETIRQSGIFAAVTLSFRDDIISGNYTFCMKNINASVKNDYSNHYQLQDSMINRESQNCYFYINKNQIYIPVQTTVTTAPVTTTITTTTAPVTTTVTTTTTPVTTTAPSVKADITNDERKAMEYINTWRKNKGLSELTINDPLCFIADIRATEIKTYYSDLRPDGTSTDTLIAKYNAPGKYTNFEYYMVASDPESFYSTFSTYIEGSSIYSYAANPNMKYIGIGMKNGYSYMIMAR